MKYSKFLILAILSIAFISSPAKAQDYEAGTVYTLWNGTYDKTICEIVAGYVNKSWICTYPGQEPQREDFFGDTDDKYLHGFQIGGLFTPSFDWGLGLRTGLFFETYTSRSKWITGWCHHFTEQDLYVPLHASFRIPFDDRFAMNIFGGIGFQWAMVGKYYQQVGTVWEWWKGWRRPIPVFAGTKHQYGNGWPQQVNWQAECGLNLRLSSFVLSFTYSFGITDHGIQTTYDDGQTYVTATRSRQDKMQATIAFTF